MSAECDRCGTDLVYGEHPEMFCEPCNLRDRIGELEEALLAIALGGYGSLRGPAQENYGWKRLTRRGMRKLARAALVFLPDALEEK